MRLEPFEIRFAAMVGVERHLRSIGSEERNKVGNEHFGWHSDIEAACAEMAFAKKAGIYWNGSIDTFKLPDVGIAQVRHTEHMNGCLVIRGRDADEELFCLMVGRAPEFVFRGWIIGVEAKRDEFVRDPGGRFPSWFVPQSALNRTSPLSARRGGVSDWLKEYGDE